MLHAPSATECVVVDVASLPPGSCRQTIENTFESLAIGAALEIVVDHDPAPLRQRFALTRPDASAWTYVEAGPTTWRVRVERLA